MRNQKGITLIALVITIIVLLILAGVSIAMLTGQNGILTQANSAKSATVRAEAVEKINLTLNALKAKIYETQVNTPNFEPLTETSGTYAWNGDTITAFLTTEEIGTSNTSGNYYYNLPLSGTGAGTLTISYFNDDTGVTTVQGTIDLTKSPYDINPAS